MPTSARKFKIKTILFFLIFSNFFFHPIEAESLCVKASRANLRSGPGTNHKKLWEVYKYMPFKQLARKGNWFRVKDVDGEVYWIHKKLITKTYKCAAVKVKKANLRKGPGTNYAQVDWSPSGKYFSMKVLKIKGRWVKTVDSMGDQAWIHRSLIWIR